MLQITFERKDLLLYVCPSLTVLVRLSGAIILKMSHGYTIEPQKPDPLVKLGDDALLDFSRSVQAGTWLVDVLPFCERRNRVTPAFTDERIVQHIPDWFPGTGFKRIAKKIRENSDAMAERPHAFVKKQMVSALFSMRPT